MIQGLRLYSASAVSVQLCLLFCLLFFRVQVLAAEVDSEGSELPRTGQRTCYSEEGEIIDHTDTGQDGDLQAGVPWPEPRFTRNGDGTISDHLTGLMWLGDGSCLGYLSWQTADEKATRVNEQVLDGRCPGYKADYEDWRLPEIRELETLVNAEAANNAMWLSSRGFSSVKKGPYWSRTVGPNPYRAWVIDMDTGKVLRSPKVKNSNVLLVRREKSGIALVPGGDPPAEIDQRFTDSGNGTVIDSVSGLMWLKDANCLGRVDWQASLEKADLFNDNAENFDCTDYRAPYQDWALPNRHELRSLIDHGYDMPALPSDHPFMDIKPRYWTSTSFAADPEKAYLMNTGWGDLLTVDKSEKNNVLLVRPVGGRADRARMPDKTQTPEIESEDYLLRPLGGYIAIDWPATRFTRHGDGTIIDNVTGLMWLRDANCFGRRTRNNALRGARLLNENPRRFDCEEYTGEYNDWHIPSFATLLELAEAAEGESAAWLNRQGAVNVQARDYWSTKENYYNLYHGWAVNFQDGEPRNYPESFKLYVWPVRTTRVVGPITPEPVIKANGKTGEIQLEKGKELVLAVAVDEVKTTPPAVYGLYYEAPDGRIRWLDSSGRWRDEKTVMHSGLLFQLDDYPVFRADTIHSEVGKYTFHFSVEVTVNPDLSPTYSDTIEVTVE